MHLRITSLICVTMLLFSCSDSPDYPLGATVDPLARAPGLHLEEWHVYRNEGRRWGRDIIQRYTAEERFDLHRRPLSKDEDWCFESHLDEAQLKKDLAVMQTRHPGSAALWSRFFTTLKWLRNFQDQNCDGPEMERVALIVEAVADEGDTAKRRVRSIIESRAFWSALTVVLEVNRALPGSPEYEARQLYLLVTNPGKAHPSSRKTAQAAGAAVGLMLFRNPALTPAQAAQGLFLTPMPGEDDRT